MDRRAKLASAAAISATLLTGGIAAAATTGALHDVNGGPAEQVRLVDDANVAAAGQVVPPAANLVEAAAGAASPAVRVAPAVLANARPAGPARVEGVVAPAGIAPRPGGSSDSSADEPQPPPTLTPTPTVAPPPSGCTGSDDGMTEAQKQAREAACHAAGAHD